MKKVVIRNRIDHVKCPSSIEPDITKNLPENVAAFQVERFAKSTNSEQGDSIDEFDSSSKGSDRDENESKTPLTADDSIDDWIGQLIELAVNHFQQLHYKAMSERFCHEEELACLESSEMDDVSDQFHSSYLKYITCYTHFDELFINKSIRQQDVIDQGMDLFRNAIMPYDARGFEAYLVAHFSEKFNYRMISKKPTLDDVSQKASPVTMCFERTARASTPTSIVNTANYLTPERLEPTKKTGSLTSSITLKWGSEEKSSSTKLKIRPRSPLEEGSIFNSNGAKKAPRKADMADRLIDIDSISLDGVSLGL